ncbi:MAG: chromosomal replication initiator protein DnaA [Anaerolineae bacterium]
MDAQEAWEIAYSQLELQLDRGTFNTWLRGATLLRVEDGIFVVGVRNHYSQEMLQHRLYRQIRRVMSDVCGVDIELRFEVHTPNLNEKGEPEMPLFRLLAEQQDGYEQPSYTPLHERVGRPVRPALPESELNPRYVFDRFIVNGSNRIAYEAANAVTEVPGRAYNPLMIYGGVGLGKTHLLQAIGHICQSRGLKVIYIPSEAFTNDLVDSIRSKTTPMFRERYRSADVLLVDDVQFIAGKDSTQEEFFHTFNALYTFNKQIVLASDRHPSELTMLEDRLRSRFAGGLVTDVKPLELESRMALLKMWAHERHIVLEKSVLEMIASRAHDNVRELEGLFNQIVAKIQLSHGGMTIDSAEETLEQFHRPRLHGRRVSVKLVIDMTAEHFNLKSRDLVGKSRTGRINQARQVAMYLARELTEMSLPQIGDAFGGRSHTTVLHGCNKIQEEMEHDSALEQRVRALYEDIINCV